MKLKYYEVDEEEILRVKGKERVIVKLPEGFMNHASKILEFLNENGINAVLHAEPFYGACDFQGDEGAMLAIGEAEMPYLAKAYPNIFFVEAKYDFDVSFLEKVVDKIKDRVGIASITPFIHKINDCKKFLEERGKKVYMGKRGRRTKYDGQILGCDFSSAIMISPFVDEFIFIGDGLFHAIGLSVATRKDVVIANPITGEIERCREEKEKLLKKRYAVIGKAMDCESFGIIVGKKIGQRRTNLAIQMKKMAERHGKRVELLVADTITNYIDYFDFDAFVSTACPRVAIDDAESFKKPVLTPIEFEILLGERQWSNYEFDQIL